MNFFSPYQEVGESSKLARSFERVRSIIRKRRHKSVLETTVNDSQSNLKLDDLVIRMMKSKHNEGPVADTTFTEEEPLPNIDRLVKAM